MATAIVVKSWQDATVAYLAVRVTEVGGNVEYIGSMPLTDLVNLTVAERKATLVAAVKAVRDAQWAGAAVGLGIAGTVTV